MTILSFCRRKKTNRHVHVDAGGGAAAPSPSSPAELPAEIIGHFGLQDQNCLQADLDVSRRCNDILHSSGIVDAGSILSLLLSSSCPAPPNTAPLLTTKTCATPPAALAASSTTPPPTSSTFRTRTCHACRRPILRSEGCINFSTRNQEEKRCYHIDCFTCAHCQAPIDPRCQKYFCATKLSVSSGKKKRTTKKTTIQDETSRDGDHDDSDEERRPLHQECFSRHFGYMCVVCDEPLPLVTTFSEIKGGDHLQNDKAIEQSRKNSIVKYIKHPYFDTERMCPHHAQASPFFGIPRDVHPDDAIDDVSRHTHTTTSEKTKIGSVRRCAGCHRFEPVFASPSKHFIDVGDSDTGRCVCLACVGTVVMTSDDVVPLWNKVANFFEGPLGLLTPEDSRSGSSGVARRELMDIPILVVGMEAMNENVKHRPSGAHDPSGAVTGGMCLSERIRPIGSCGGGGGGKGFGVTAILCLSGLPADLAASILAHEAFHAWIKLHPNFTHTNPLPRRVEEGLAQLVAFLFLDGLDPIDMEGYVTTERGQQGGGEINDNPRNAPEEEDESGIPWEARLRQYFKFCIETDESVVYGQGFRAAALAYAKLGIQELLYYVALNQDFPPM